MYPYVLENSYLHLLDDIGVLFTNIGNYILNDIEVYIIEKFDGAKSLDYIIKEISNEIESDNIDEIRNIIFQFIESKSDVISCAESIKYSPLKITGTKGGKIPMSLTFSLTDKCNLKCIHCFKSCSSNNNSQIPYNSLIKTLQYLKDKSVSVQLTGGEPMLYDDFYKILDYCKNNFRTSITTTGTLITNHNVEKFKGVDNVQVSLYSIDKAKHDAITTIIGSFDRTINGIRECVNAGINVTIATLLTHDTINEIEDIINLGIELKVSSVRFGTFSPLGRGISIKDSWLLNSEEMLEIEKVIDKLSIKYEKQIYIQKWEGSVKKQELVDKYDCLGCGAGVITWVIDENGNIKPCEFFPDDIYSMGNIINDDIEIVVNNINFSSMPSCIKHWQNSLSLNDDSLQSICNQMSDYYLNYCQ